MTGLADWCTVFGDFQFRGERFGSAAFAVKVNERPDAIVLKQFVSRVVIMRRIETDILQIQAISMLAEFLMKQEETDRVMTSGIEKPET